MMELKNYIGGQYVAPIDAHYLLSVNPATLEKLANIPASNSKDVDAAVIAAKAAFASWKSTSADERAGYLRKMADALEARLEEFAKLESLDNGKPLSLSTAVDIPRSVKNLRFFADAVTQFHGDSFSEHPAVLNYTTYKPLGVVACISPWNLPLYLFTWKIAPAIAAGNCVVAKPSEVTPMTAALLGEIATEAGLPAGVLNIVHGLGADVGTRLTTHPDIKAISFTGSTMTGEIIARQAAPLFKKLSLEMGGKNATIVFADAGFDEALSTTLRAAFANQGQICLCGSRILVERPIYERFRDALVEKAKELVVGDPLDAKSDQGAVVSKAHFEKVLSHIAIAKEEGGKILCGGEAVKPEGLGGYFIAPTLIEGLNSSCRTNREEIFGPVATIMPFDDEEEAIRLANSTDYGLAGSIWTSDLKRAHRVAANIDSGILWINTWLNRDLRTPFGGVKHSGVGREGGDYALRFFSEVKNVCLAI